MRRINIGLVILLLFDAARCSDILICNSQSRLGAQLIADVYKRSPIVLSDECRDQSRLDKEDYAVCAFWLACGPMLDKINKRRDRCDALRQRLREQKLGINARISADQPPFDSVNVDQTRDFNAAELALLRADVVVDIDTRSTLLDFVPRTVSAVLWRTVVLAPVGPHAVENFQLPSELFGDPLSFGATTFGSTKGALQPDLVFGPALPQKASNANGKVVRGGLIIQGCAVPSFTFRVEWRRGKQQAKTERRLLQQDQVCWSRVITVTEVRDKTNIGAESRRCFLPYSMNQLRQMLLKNSRAVAVLKIQGEDWASGVRFPAAYAEMLLDCAQPASQLGGSWFGQTTTAPGICIACTSLYAKQQVRGLKVIPCNNTGEDCCLGCAGPTYMRVAATGTALGFTCVESCRPGYAYVGSACAVCGAGLYSEGGLSQCAPCPDPNSWVGRGCQRCGASAAVASASSCSACATGKYVAAGATVCNYCAAAGYTVVDSACVPCPEGTRQLEGACVLCPRDTYASQKGATFCRDCAVGFYSAAYNRTTCTPCAALSPTTMPFAEYFQPGCTVRCKPIVSYIRINPYTPHGCGSCATAVVPVGAYASPSDCTITPPCTNAPALHSYYTTASTGGPTQCGWACNTGYFANQNRCDPCVFGGGYVDARHRPSGVGCGYTCKPGIFVDAAKACNQPCVDLYLELTAMRLRARVREYAGLSRPNYVHGLCGSNESMPMADARFLRFGRWGVVGAAACGNSLLNAGEDCDDGNKVSGDGCSPMCKIETGDYWECDLIGELCVPNCGWSFKSPAPNGVGLIGFALPLCPNNICDCAQLSYRYNLEPLSPKDRAAWMADMLVKCDCGGNAMRTLPYDQCTAQNGGCRQCDAGTQYHDDLAGRCVDCGSVCAPGFTQNYNKRCDASAPDGCVPCPSRQGVRFVRGCAGACVDEYYCTSATLLENGVCPTTCLPCSSKLFQLTVHDKPTNAAGVTIVGMYPKGCSDGLGYEWAPCDVASRLNLMRLPRTIMRLTPEGRPAGAYWTSNALVPGGKCDWACDSQYFPWRGRCVPCFAYTGGAVTQCHSGQRVEWCVAGSSACCLPCIGALPGARQAWTSDPPYYSMCRADCEPLVSYSLYSNATECLPCNRDLTCAVGEYLIECTPRGDAKCALCPPLATDLLEYAAACQTRCIAGFYADPIAVNVCLPCDTQCDPGFYVSPPTCIALNDRLARPVCLQCPPLQVNQVYVSGCSVQCAYGFVATNGTLCQPCRAALCGIGYNGECTNDSPSTTQLVCTPCATRDGLAVPGDCTLFIIAPDNKYNAATTPPPTAQRKGGLAHPELQYPTRARRHSGMS